jgi:hypothetical protein
MRGFVLASNWRRMDRKESSIDINQLLENYIGDNIDDNSMHHPSELIMEAIT